MGVVGEQGSATGVVDGRRPPPGRSWRLVAVSEWSSLRHPAVIELVTGIPSPGVELHSNSDLDARSAGASATQALLADLSAVVASTSGLQQQSV